MASGLSLGFRVEGVAVLFLAFLSGNYRRVRLPQVPGDTRHADHDTAGAVPSAAGPWALIL